MMKFNIYNKRTHEYVKKDCTLESIIDSGHTLSDDEVRRYFKIDEDHRHWERAHRPTRVRRYVFDRCIVPDSPDFEIEYVYGEEDD